MQATTEQKHPIKHPPDSTLRASRSPYPFEAYLMLDRPLVTWLIESGRPRGGPHPTYSRGFGIQDGSGNRVKACGPKAMKSARSTCRATTPNLFVGPSAPQEYR